MATTTLFRVPPASEKAGDLFTTKHQAGHLNGECLNAVDLVITQLSNLRLQVMAHEEYLRHIGHSQKFDDFCDWEKAME